MHLLSIIICPPLLKQEQMLKLPVVMEANLALRLAIQLPGSFSLTFGPLCCSFLSAYTIMCLCTICREVTFTSASNSKPNSKKRSEENENFSGDFLTLAPPSPTSYAPSKSMSSSTLLAFQNQVCPEFEFLSLINHFSPFWYVHDSFLYFIC